MKHRILDVGIIVAIIPVIIQAAVMVGITFFGFGLALFNLLLK